MSLTLCGKSRDNGKTMTDKMRQSEINFKTLGFSEKQMYEFPKIVNLEVYRGNCPCSCVHCPVGITTPDKRKKRFGQRGINLGLYRKVVEEISLHPSSTLRIHSAGEPLLWKELPEALGFTYDKGVRSWVFTCAVTNDKHLLNILCRNTDIIEVSVNSTTPEDYKATKGIDTFGLVVENIKYMHDLLSKRLPARLIVSRVQSLDRDADNEFVKYWRSTGLVDDAFLRTYHTYNDLMPKVPNERRIKHKACLVHWARFNISVDGYAVVCFNELFKEKLEHSLILGDLNKELISNIWHGSKLTALRHAELTSNYSRLDFADVLPCKNCYSCQPLNSNEPTSEYQIKQLEGGEDAESL